MVPGGLKWTMVYSTSGFLFALAMDYDLFLFARVYERRMQGYDNASAVRIALEETGPLISLAGAPMGDGILMRMMVVNGWEMMHFILWDQASCLGIASQ